MKLSKALQEVRVCSFKDTILWKSWHFESQNWNSFQIPRYFLRLYSPAIPFILSHTLSKGIVTTKCTHISSRLIPSITSGFLANQTMDRLLLTSCSQWMDCHDEIGSERRTCTQIHRIQYRYSPNMRFNRNRTIYRLDWARKTFPCTVEWRRSEPGEYGCMRKVGIQPCTS